MDKLSSSELLMVKGNGAEAPGAWLANYANDLFLDPGNHLPEIGLAVAAAGVGTAFATRRFLAELRETAAMAASDTVAKKATPALETFARMDKRSVDDAVQMLKTKHGIEVRSWGNTQIEGSRGAGTSVLRASDLAALQITRDANTVYAHKISISDSGSPIASYYTNSPMNLKNHWVPNESAAWPLNKGGPFDGLKQSGVHVLDLNSKPRGLHFTPQLDSLSIRWTDLRALTVPANRTLSDTAIAAAKSDLYSSIEVRGKDAVTKGLGQISLNPAK